MAKDEWEWKGWEQLGRIQSTLVMTAGTLQERLTKAVQEVAHLKADMVPEKHREALQSIVERLTAVAPVGGEGAFASSIAAMGEEERQQIAGELLDLWCECERAWSSEEG